MVLLIPPLVTLTRESITAILWRQQKCRSPEGFPRRATRSSPSPAAAARWRTAWRRRTPRRGSGRGRVRRRRRNPRRANHPPRTAPPTRRGSLPCGGATHFRVCPTRREYKEQMVVSHPEGEGSGLWSCMFIQPRYVLCCLPYVSRRGMALSPGPNA
jgi:hypothetical protein